MSTPPRPPADALDAEWAARYRRRIHRCPSAVRAVLAELAAHPGRCTSELGALEPVHGQANASRLLADLEDREILFSLEEPSEHGGRPRRLWRLTPAGARLAGLAGQQ